MSGKLLVQALVVDDKFDDLSGDADRIEQPVDENGIAVVIIDSEIRGVVLIRPLNRRSNRGRTPTLLFKVLYTGLHILSLSLTQNTCSGTIKAGKR